MEEPAQDHQAKRLSVKFYALLGNRGSRLIINK